MSQGLVDHERWNMVELNFLGGSWLQAPPFYLSFDQSIQSFKKGNTSLDASSDVCVALRFLDATNRKKKKNNIIKIRGNRSTTNVIKKTILNILFFIVCLSLFI